MPNNSGNMRANTRMVILFTILVGVAAYAAIGPQGRGLLTTGQLFSPPTRSSESGPSAARSQNSATKEVVERFALRERVPLSETDGALFGSRAWQPPPSQTASKPAAPTAPPMPYRFAGKLLQDGRLQVFLSKGDTTIPVREGETLDGIYRVESIGEDHITLVYLPLKHKETIPVFSLIQNEGAQAQPVLQAKPSQVVPRLVRETAPPDSTSGVARRVPVPTASMLSGR